MIGVVKQLFYMAIGAVAIGPSKTNLQTYNILGYFEPLLPKLSFIYLAYATRLQL